MEHIYFKSSQKMDDVENGVIDLIITSPPYFNIKDYAKNGYQDETHSKNHAGQIGDIKNYKTFLKELQKVWKECERVLKPNGKLIINTPLMPMEFTTHYNRHIFDLNSDIQSSIIYRKNTEMFLFDTYIWNRTIHRST